MGIWRFLLLLLPPLHPAPVLQECHCALLLHPVHFPSARIQGLPKGQQPQLWQSDGVCVCLCACVCTPECLWEDWEGHWKSSKSGFCSVKYFSLCLASLRLSSCQQNAKPCAAVMALRGRWYLELVTLGFNSWGSFGCFLPKNLAACFSSVAVVLKEPCPLQVSWGKEQ